MQHKSFWLFEKAPESVIEKTEGVTIDIFKSFCLFEQVPESVIVDLPSMTDATESVTEDAGESIPLFLNNQPAVGGEEEMRHKSFCLFEKAPQSVIEKTEGVTIDIFKSFCLFEQVPESVIVDLPSMTDSTESVTEDTGESILLFPKNQKSCTFE